MLLSLTFLKIKFFFQKKLSGTLSETESKMDWVQSVYKGHLQTTKVTASKE